MTFFTRSAKCDICNCSIELDLPSSIEEYDDMTLYYLCSTCEKAVRDAEEQLVYLFEQRRDAEEDIQKYVPSSDDKCAWCGKFFYAHTTEQLIPGDNHSFVPRTNVERNDLYHYRLSFCPLL